VAVDSFVETVLLPDVDLSALSTRIEATFSIGSNNAVRHGGDVSVLSSIDSSMLLLSSGEVPELDVLGSSGTEFVGSRSSTEADVVDLVGVSLRLVFLLASGSIEHVDAMVVGHVDGSKLSAVRRDGDGLDTTRALGHDGASFLSSSTGIPGEDQRDGSTLSSNSERTVGGNGKGHDVVVVTVLFS